MLVMNSIRGNTERAVPDVDSFGMYQYDNRPSARGVVLVHDRGLTMSLRPESLREEGRSILKRQILESPFVNCSLFLNKVIIDTVE